MAVDFEAIKRKLDQLSGNNKKSSSNWRPQEGEEYTVRLLSFPENNGGGVPRHRQRRIIFFGNG